MTKQAAPGWYQDGRGSRRWWSGRGWTSFVELPGEDTAPVVQTIPLPTPRELRAQQRADAKLAAERRRRPVEVIRGPGNAPEVRVAGVSFRQPALRSVGIGWRDDFTFRADPKNAVDREAVGIWNGPHHLGFLPHGYGQQYSAQLLALARSNRAVHVRGFIDEWEKGLYARVELPSSAWFEALT